MLDAAKQKRKTVPLYEHAIELFSELKIAGSLTEVYTGRTCPHCGVATVWRCADDMYACMTLQHYSEPFNGNLFGFICHLCNVLDGNFGTKLFVETLQRPGFKWCQHHKVFHPANDFRRTGRYGGRPYSDIEAYAKSHPLGYLVALRSICRSAEIEHKENSSMVTKDD